MGFAPASIEWALRATRNAGLQPAMDHLLAHAGETPPAAGDDDDEEQEALADMLGKKGAGAQEEMIVGAGEAKVSGQEGPIRRAAASCGALRQGMKGGGWSAAAQGVKDASESSPSCCGDDSGAAREVKGARLRRAAAEATATPGSRRFRDGLQRTAGDELPCRDSMHALRVLNAVTLAREARRRLLCSCLGLPCCTSGHASQHPVAGTRRSRSTCTLTPLVGCRGERHLRSPALSFAALVCTAALAPPLTLLSSPSSASSAARSSSPPRSPHSTPKRAATPTSRRAPRRSSR
jgi:hypothetical protein